MISVIVHEKDDNEQFPRELFRICLHDPNQKGTQQDFKHLIQVTTESN